MTAEDDFGGYLDEDESDDEDGEGDNGDDPSGDMMETETPPIPPHTLQPGSSMTEIFHLTISPYLLMTEC